MAGLARGLPEVLFHAHLRGDARMVRSGKPQGFISLLPRAAHQDILNGVVQHMAQVEHSRDVGGRNDDGVGRLFGSRVSLETTFFNPEGLPLFFHEGRIICFGQIRHAQEGNIKFFSFNPYMRRGEGRDINFIPSAAA